MKIIIINNRGQYNHRIQRSLQNLDIPCELVSNSLTVDEIKEKEPMGLILGGGPSIELSGNSSDYIGEIDVPTLGICLGHQLIALKYGGEVIIKSTELFSTFSIALESPK